MLQAMVSAADGTAVELFDAVADLSVKLVEGNYLALVAVYSAAGRVTQYKNLSEAPA